MIKLNVLLTEVTEFCIAGIHDLSLDPEKVNVNGGSIAILKHVTFYQFNLKISPNRGSDILIL